jgi:hypothetical protein
MIDLNRYGWNDELNQRKKGKSFSKLIDEVKKQKGIG